MFVCWTRIWPKQDGGSAQPGARSTNRTLLSAISSVLHVDRAMRLSHARKSSESYGRLHFHDCSWQCEMKRRASSVVGCGPQTATMRFHDGTADRQPHAAALGFSGEEGIEDLVRSSGGQSYSGVADGDQHFTALAW